MDGLESPVDFGAGLVSPSSFRDGFVARYSRSDGSYAGLTVFSGGAGTMTFAAIAVGDDGAVYAAGTSGGGVDFGGGVLDEGAFVVKLNSTGGHVWSRNFAASAFDIAVGPDGDPVLAGRTAQSTDFGTGLLVPGAFLVKLAGSSGGTLWAQSFASAEAMTVIVNELNEIVFGGHVNPGGDFGAGPETARSAFASKRSVDGNHIWTTSFPGGINSSGSPTITALQLANNAFLQADERVVSLGYFRSIQLGETTYFSDGDGRFLVSLYDPAEP